MPPGYRGSADADETDVSDQEKIERLLGDVVGELDDRIVSCGESPEGYPFDVSPTGIGYRSAEGLGAYCFLLLLSLFGHKAGPQGTFAARVFEILCAEALRAYFGAPGEGVDSLVFGSPRPVLPSNFAEAVDHLCREMGDGGCHKDQPGISSQKDAYLDVVAWRKFPDRRTGQLIAFGQCSTGDDWFDKLTGLQVREFCTLWMRQTPSVLPIQTFFTPKRVDPCRWRRANLRGGIFFARCRITWLVRDLSDALPEQVGQWAAQVLTSKAE